MRHYTNPETQLQPNFDSPVIDNTVSYHFHSDKLAMSGIWGWFGGGAAQKRKDTPKNVILDLRTQLEMLQKREIHLTRQIEEQEQVAKKNVTTNKTGMAFLIRPRPCDSDTDTWTSDSCQGGTTAQEDPRA